MVFPVLGANWHVGVLRRQWRARPLESRNQPHYHWL